MIMTCKTIYELFGEPIELNRLETLPTGKYELEIKNDTPQFEDVSMGDYIIDTNSIVYTLHKISIDFYYAITDHNIQKLSLTWCNPNVIKLNKDSEVILSWHTADLYPTSKSNAIKKLSLKIHKIIASLD